MHLARGSAPTHSKHSSDLDPNSSPCARQSPLSQTPLGNSNHHSSRLSPNQYVHLPSGPSPDHSNSQSLTPTQHMFAQCPQYRSSPVQHPYLLYQTAAQYPSPGDRMRSGPRHIRRAPSVEAESPDELQVSTHMFVPLIQIKVLSLMLMYICILDSPTEKAHSPTNAAIKGQRNLQLCKSC